MHGHQQNVNGLTVKFADESKTPKMKEPTTIFVLNFSFDSLNELSLLL